MKPLFSHLLPAAALTLASLAPAVHAAPADLPHYAVQQRWELGPRTRWDYVSFDPVRHRLYLTRGDRVDVVDAASGKVVGTIPDTQGVHGVAFAQDLHLGFTSNGRSNTVTVFDLDTLKPRQEIAVPGKGPDAILYDQSTHKLYTFNGKSADISVFDAASLKPVATIPVGGRPEFAVADGKAHVFLNVEDKSEIAMIDGHTDKLVAHWPLKNCEEPSGLALDEAHGRLFSVCSNKMMAVTDSASGQQVAQVAIGGHPDAAVYDAASGTVFASNGEGSLSVVRQLDANRYDPAITVQTARGARTLALDAGQQRVYLPAMSGETFTVLVVSP